MTSKLMNRNGANLIARKKRLFQTAKSTVETTAKGIRVTVSRQLNVSSRHHQV